MAGGRGWPKPKTPAEAARRWGKSGTVSIDFGKLGLEMRVLATPVKKRGRQLDPNQDITWGDSTALSYFRDEAEITGIRFSGHPDALLAMFRALHIEFAKRRSGNQVKEIRKRTIILDTKENGNE